MHIDANRRPLVEPAELGAAHLLELIPRGSSTSTPPHLALDVTVETDGTKVVLWIAGRRFAVLRTAGRG